MRHDPPVRPRVSVGHHVLRARRGGWRREQPHVAKHLMHQMTTQTGFSRQRTDAERSTWRYGREPRRHGALCLVTGPPRSAGPWRVGGDRVEPAVPEAVAPQPDGRLAGAEQLRRPVHGAPGGQLQEDAAAARDPRRGARCRHPALEMLALELAENDGQGPRGRHVVDPPGGEAVVRENDGRPAAAHTRRLSPRGATSWGPEGN